MKQKAQLISLILFLNVTFISSFNTGAFDAMFISNLRCEMLKEPEGIDVTRPGFSWQTGIEERGMEQMAYQVIVASSAAKLNQNDGDLWNSGKVLSDQSVHVSYAGKPLTSRQDCFWKVKVWSNNGEVGWSTAAHFSMGLLQKSDWKAKWIGLDRAFAWDSVSKFARLSARYFRKEIEISKKID